MEYSTEQVMQKLDVSRDTFYRWLRTGLKAPRLRKVGGMKIRLWTKEDFARAKKFAAKRYRRKLSKLREEE